MPQPPRVTSSRTESRIQLAIFHLQDACVMAQEEWNEFPRTAALEARPGTASVFRWLGKRGVEIALISDVDREATCILMDRVGWTVGQDALVQYVVCATTDERNPIECALQLAGLAGGSRAITVSDTPDLLRAAERARVYFNLGLCNGRCAYQELSPQPHHAILDNLIQLPGFLLDALVIDQPVTVPQRGKMELSLLWVPSRLA